MPIENLPLFNAQNDEEVKPPFHGHNCPPGTRPYTSQEAHMAIMQRVNACVNEVNHFERRMEDSFKAFMDKCDFASEAFKDAIQASYNSFMELVRTEVNNFENTINADYETFTGDINARFASLSEALNSDFLSQVQHLNEMEAEYVEKFADFIHQFTTFKTETILAIETYKGQIDETVAAIDAKVTEAYNYLKTNLPETAADALHDMAENGELKDVFYDAFGGGGRFIGTFETYANITAHSGAANGDYAYCLADGHYYKRSNTDWYDIGTGDLIANQFLEYVDSDTYTFATLLNNLNIHIDTVNRNVSLTKTTANPGIIFTPKRWVEVAENCGLEYQPIVVENPNGFTGAFVYNNTDKQIHVRKMSLNNPHFIFDGDDVILFCAYIDVKGALKFTFTPIPSMNVDGSDYPIEKEVKTGLGYEGNFRVNIDTKNSKLICTGTGYVFGNYTGGVHFSKYLTAHETPVTLKKASHTFAVVIDANNELQIRTQGEQGVNPYQVNDLFLGVAYVEYEGGVYILSKLCCASQLEPMFYFNATPAFVSHELMNKNTSRIFRRVCCVGDSYTSGYIFGADGVEYPNNPEYAWPHYMEKITGNEWINCGVSGANVLTWMSDENGYEKAAKAGKVQAYVIGLMLNDASGSERGVPIGTQDDIATGAPTFYGGYGVIINQLRKISPNAKFFLLTCPKEGAVYRQYNKAVRDIAKWYRNNTRKVYVLDLEEKRAMFDMDSFTSDLHGGHYTAIGYEQMAEVINGVLSNFLNNNVELFQDVAFLECDTPFVTAENGQYTIRI